MEDLRYSNHDDPLDGGPSVQSLTSTLSADEYDFYDNESLRGGESIREIPPRGALGAPFGGNAGGTSRMNSTWSGNHGNNHGSHHASRSLDNSPSNHHSGNSMANTSINFGTNHNNNNGNNNNGNNNAPANIHLNNVSANNTNSNNAAQHLYRDGRQPTDDEMSLLSENQRLEGELAQLQCSLLESLKRQDRFISGGQFKGPPNRNKKNSNMRDSKNRKYWQEENPRKPTRSEVSFAEVQVKRLKAKNLELEKEIQGLRQNRVLNAKNYRT